MTIGGAAEPLSAEAAGWLEPLSVVATGVDVDPDDPPEDDAPDDGWVTIAVVGRAGALAVGALASTLGLYVPGSCEPAEPSNTVEGVLGADGAAVGDAVAFGALVETGEFVAELACEPLFEFVDSRATGGTLCPIAERDIVRIRHNSIELQIDCSSSFRCVTR